MQLPCCKANLLSFKILAALTQNFNSTLFMQMLKWFKLKVHLCKQCSAFIFLFGLSENQACLLPSQLPVV